MEWMSEMLGSAAVCVKNELIKTAVTFIHSILLADRAKLVKRRGFSDHQ